MASYTCQSQGGPTCWVFLMIQMTMNRKTKFDKDKRVVHLLNIYWINFKRDVKDTRLRKKHWYWSKNRSPRRPGRSPARVNKYWDSRKGNGQKNIHPPFSWEETRWHWWSSAGPCRPWRSPAWTTRNWEITSIIIIIIIITKNKRKTLPAWATRSRETSRWRSRLRSCRRGCPVCGPARFFFY